MELNKKELLKKLTTARSSLLYKEPFYGTLLMKLKFSLAPCGTACTDMERIYWDPEFLGKLTQEETELVMLHELLHCVLGHCVRRKNKNPELYNIAADIVVNSNILQARGLTEFVVDGIKLMHKAPDGKEGSLYTVEQVYDMLLVSAQMVQSSGNGQIDNHEIWSSVKGKEELEQEWMQEIINTVNQKGCSPEGTPACIRQILEELDYESKLNWKEILHDFVQLVNDTYDYTFSPADKRFSDTDFIIPAYYEMETEEVKNLWFVVDTSASISQEMLSDMFSEIKSALIQLEGLEGKLSFFDTAVTEPLEFDNVRTLSEIKPVGGGGTSFFSIFAYMNDYMMEDLPAGVIIMTDGWASFPKEEVSLGVPVLWCIVENPDCEPPWGTVVHVIRKE